MSYFMMAGAAALIFMNAEYPTTIKFEEPIEFYSLGNQGDFFTHKSNNSKILVIKPKKIKFKTPMVVITKKASYQFLVVDSVRHYQSYLEVKSSMPSRTYRPYKSTPYGPIKESDYNFLLVNPKKKNIKINGQLRSEKEIYISKGSKILIEGEIY
ncbi:MAG: hypothetical protein HOE90_06780 [Bacteriovoracaceae bacterium]|jgi:hypothetical protein|nr:hypothetical protein [Bacteriovoracaceae bacterium]